PPPRRAGEGRHRHHRAPGPADQAAGRRGPAVALTAACQPSARPRSARLTAMAHLLCHAEPDTLTLDTEVLDVRPGRVLLQRSPFYPGGGGQPPDRGTLEWGGGATAVKGFEPGIEGIWHLLADEVELTGPVRATVDPAFRRLMRAVHTDTHI